VEGAARCIGRTDLWVDPRKARRLARRIRAVARRQSLPRTVWTSPARRCRAVGLALRRLGFVWRVDQRLQEMDFGAWEGRLWNTIDPASIQAWSDDLLNHPPGGGECLRQVAARARSFADEVQRDGPDSRIVVGHAGWINALHLVPPGTERLAAADWPTGPRHGELRLWPRAIGGTAG
jgi:alpha-ribazole phosphatase